MFRVWGLGFRVRGLEVREGRVVPLFDSKVTLVSIVVPFVGLTDFVVRILQGSRKTELQWRR